MQISDDVIEHLRELRRLAYKDTRTLKCRQRKKKNEPKKEVWYWTGEWLKLSENMERKLHKGMKYIIKPKTGAISENVRSMYFDNVIHNTKGQPMFIFRSKAGYIESFTIQQMQDYIFEADRK